MEDSGIIKKSKIIFIVFLVISIICLIIYMIFGQSESSGNKPNSPTIPTNVNENGIYGLFVNLDDPNSYFKYSENGQFEFILNACEGYITYNNDNAKITKDVSAINDSYSIKITIIPKSSKDTNKFKFIGNLISATGVVDLYDGPDSCSTNFKYKRA